MRNLLEYDQSPVSQFNIRAFLDGLYRRHSHSDVLFTLAQETDARAFT
jgi:hypothetical protein